MSHHSPLPNIPLPSPASAGIRRALGHGTCLHPAPWVAGLSSPASQELLVGVTPARAGGADVGLDGLARPPLPGLWGDQV